VAYFLSEAAFFVETQYETPFKLSTSRRHARGGGGLGAILTAGAQGQKEKAAEAAFAYANVRSRSAALHRCPTDHIDRAYTRRPAHSQRFGGGM
jgi:hypothetical protein